VPEAELLRHELRQLLNGCRDGTAKIIVTRGSGPRGYRPPDHCLPTRAIGLETGSVTPANKAGVRLRYCTTRISRNPLLAGIKTLNRLEQVMARAEWSDTAVAEGLMLNDRDEVVCGTMTNLFYIRDGVLHTPDLHECGVSGVMRQQVLAVARKEGIEVRELPVNQQQLAAADELFLTNALIGVWPAVELAEKHYACGAITRRIMHCLAALGVQECAA
jgi:4-amino-4-deoxychorismate lyase